MHLKREKYTYMGGNAKAKRKEEERNLANLWNLRYTKEVLTGAESKPVNLFDRAYVNEKQSGHKILLT